jgi:hypothetical protein
LTQVRKLTAPLSAVFLIVVAGLAFTFLHTGTEYPPPILDPEFGLWISDRDFGGKRPMVWQLEYERGVGDQILLQQTTIADKTALEIQIFQDGADQRWTYVRLGQTIDGTRLRALLDEEVGIWVFLLASCACNRPPSDQTGIFEIQTNDGTHVLDFIFTETVIEMNASPTHRTIFLQTPRGEWAHYPIDLAMQYKEAQWRPPDRVSLSIILGAPRAATGWHTAYVHGFSVTKKTAPSLEQQQRPTTIPLSISIPSILLGAHESTKHFQDRYARVGLDVRLSQGFNR